MGGPIAILKDGDLIVIDIPSRTIEVQLSNEEISYRLNKWVAPSPKVTKGVLNRYALLVESAERGAYLRESIDLFSDNTV